MTEPAPFILDPLQENDAEDLNRMMLDNAHRFRRFFSRTLSQNMTLRDSRAYIVLKHGEAVVKKEFTWALRSQADEKVKGLLIVREIDWEGQSGELSYCIGKAQEGKGWATQAVTLLSDFIFSEFNLKTLQLFIHKSNLASLRVAEKAGFTWVETLPKHYTPPGESALDMERYQKKA